MGPFPWTWTVRLGDAPALTLTMTWQPRPHRLVWSGEAVSLVLAEEASSVYSVFSRLAPDESLLDDPRTFPD